MAKKVSKRRRAWTTADVRVLKTLAKKKTRAAKNRSDPEAYRGRDAAKGVQCRSVIKLTSINF